MGSDVQGKGRVGFNAREPRLHAQFLGRVGGHRLGESSTKG